MMQRCALRMMTGRLVSCVATAVPPSTATCLKAPRSAPPPPAAAAAASPVRQRFPMRHMSDSPSRGPGPSTGSGKANLYPGPSCWSCKHFLEPANTVVCNACDMIQPPDANVSYFKLLGVEESFDVDRKALDRAFQDLQRRVHPDHFGRKSTTEQEYSSDTSSLVNEAYNVLKDTHSRAKYMLSRKGREIDEKATVDADFLMHVFELSECVEGQLSEDEARALHARLAEELSQSYQRISKSFEDNDLDTVVEECLRNQYRINLVHQVRAQIPV